MVNELDKATLAIISTFALKHSYAYGEEWYSSAKNLEEDLKKKGVNVKIFHEYQMPEKKSQSEYLRRVALYDFYANFEIYNFQDDFKKEIKDYALYSKAIDYIKSQSQSNKEKMDKAYKTLIALNPELPKLSDRQDEVIYGAIFGFSPADIEYFARGRFEQGVNHMEKRAMMNKTLEGYGLDVGFIISPKTFETIIAALEKNKNNMQGYARD
ncbi:MAG: hypothetical protein IKZ34_01790 [Alphaproteobacteria bacterium]|nr:hypothetical protein [Alphaproteobacteria bacterium]